MKDKICFRKLFSSLPVRSERPEAVAGIANSLPRLNQVLPKDKDNVRLEKDNHFHLFIYCVLCQMFFNFLPLSNF
jgi:hypothetical protein